MTKTLKFLGGIAWLILLGTLIAGTQINKFVIGIAFLNVAINNFMEVLDD